MADRADWVHLRAGGDDERGQQADHPEQWDDNEQSQWASAAGGADWRTMHSGYSSEHVPSTTSAVNDEVMDTLAGIHGLLDTLATSIDLVRDANVSMHTRLHSTHWDMQNDLKQFVSSELTEVQDELKDCRAQLQQLNMVVQQQVLFVC